MNYYLEWAESRGLNEEQATYISDYFHQKWVAYDADTDAAVGIIEKPIEWVLDNLSDHTEGENIKRHRRLFDSEFWDENVEYNNDIVYERSNYNVLRWYTTHTCTAKIGDRYFQFEAVETDNDIGNPTEEFIINPKIIEVEAYETVSIAFKPLGSPKNLDVDIIKQIDEGTLSKLVSETYGRPYQFQQQEGCMQRGVRYVTIPTEGEDYDDSGDYTVNGKDMGVSFETWKSTPIKQRSPDYLNDIFWERNFYPNLDMVLNDLHAKGLIEAGDYQINIDW